MEYIRNSTHFVYPTILSRATLSGYYRWIWTFGYWSLNWVWVIRWLWPIAPDGPCWWLNDESMWMPVCEVWKCRLLCQNVSTNYTITDYYVVVFYSFFILIIFLSYFLKFFIFHRDPDLSWLTLNSILLLFPLFLIYIMYTMASYHSPLLYVTIVLALDFPLQLFISIWDIVEFPTQIIYFHLRYRWIVLFTFFCTQLFTFVLSI